MIIPFKSEVGEEWVQNYAENDGKVRLYRWVSGSSKYANYVYGDSAINYNEIGRLDSNNIRTNQDYFFIQIL